MLNAPGFPPSTHETPSSVAARTADRSSRGPALSAASADPTGRLQELLAELGKRRLTNLLVEGGSQVLGTLFDLDCVDEVHVFVAPKLVGGQRAPSPVAGVGHAQIPELASLYSPRIEVLEGDVYITGRLREAAT